MGTRHLCCAKVDGKFRVAQYGQWDGYIGGQGETVFKFIQNLCTNNTVDEYIEILKSCRFVDDKEIADTYKNLGIDTSSGFVTDEQNKKFINVFPFMNRDIGADIFTLIADDEKYRSLNNSFDFGFDSLFCEWAYVINFDDKTLEIFSGPNEDNIYEEFNSNVEYWHTTKQESSGYYGVKFVQKYSFQDISSMSLGDIVDLAIQECEKREEDEDEFYSSIGA